MDNWLLIFLSNIHEEQEEFKSRGLHIFSKMMFPASGALLGLYFQGQAQ